MGEERGSGETVGLRGTTCTCGRELGLRVCHSAAGYYLGYWCNYCGPYSRETGYYRSVDEAERELQWVRQGAAPRGLR